MESSDEPKAEPEKKKRRAPKRKRPNDKPKRPLSAYNLFFQHERDYMLRNIPSPFGISHDEHHSTLHEDPAVRRNKSKAIRPPPHGKIGFAELAKSIGHKWRTLDSDARSYFQNLASAEKRRYEKETEIWRRKEEGKTSGEEEEVTDGRKMPPPQQLQAGLHHSFHTNGMEHGMFVQADEVCTNISTSAIEPSVSMGQGHAGFDETAYTYYDPYSIANMQYTPTEQCYYQPNAPLEQESGSYFQNAATTEKSQYEKEVEIWLRKEADEFGEKKPRPMERKIASPQQLQRNKADEVYSKNSKSPVVNEPSTVMSKGRNHYAYNGRAEFDEIAYKYNYPYNDYICTPYAPTYKQYPQPNEPLHEGTQNASTGRHTLPMLPKSKGMADQHCHGRGSSNDNFASSTTGKAVQARQKSEDGVCVVRDSEVLDFLTVLTDDSKKISPDEKKSVINIGDDEEGNITSSRAA